MHHTHSLRERADIGAHRFAYRRLSATGHPTSAQLEGQRFDAEFEDQPGEPSADRPQLDALLNRITQGDTVVCESMDRLARNLCELRAIILGVTARGASLEFRSEGLIFTAESHLALRVLDSLADLERAAKLERQRAGIAVAKAQGKYKGRKPKLPLEVVNELRRRAAAGESKTALAKKFGVSRQTLYAYLRTGS